VTLSREPPASVPSEGTAMPEPAPTIKITIGRVDVRAIMPAAHVPRPAPTRPKPALSLEDYLKQRGGEGNEHGPRHRIRDRRVERFAQ
jgi:hypothetical protein